MITVVGGDTFTWLMLAVSALLLAIGVYRVVARVRSRREAWRRIALTLVPLVAAILLVGYFADRSNNRMTAESPVRILGVDRDLSGFPDIRFSYEVGGRTYVATDGLSKGYDLGDPVKACYDPENPREVRLAWAEDDCG